LTGLVLPAPPPAAKRSATDFARNVRLLLGDDVAPSRDAGRALRTRAIPPAPVRAAQRVAMKAGLLTYERHALQPLVEARRKVLGHAAAGPPRFLIRLDEFPCYSAHDEPAKFGLEASRRFHDILAAAQVPYLVAVVPRLTAKPLDPHATGDFPLGDGEIELLQQMGGDGVTFGLHGYNHRTRFVSPQRRSELCGLSGPELEDLLDRALGTLGDLMIHPRVFVPPFNRFDASQYDVLANRFDVVTGGPESVPLMGFHKTPQWRGEAVYLPSYPPLYATSENCVPAIERLVERQVGTWIPIVLHLGWETDDWSKLERFAQAIAPYAASWDDFLAAVDASR
jgi:uncharacterized protein DUF2334